MKIQRNHLEKPAYVYIRQSSMAQVRHHQESTDRQYALEAMARELKVAGLMNVQFAIPRGNGAKGNGHHEAKVYVLEVNPLPGLTPEYSDLCLIAKAANIDYRSLIGEILSGGLKRLREKRRAEARGAEAARSGPASNGNGESNGKGDGNGKGPSHEKTPTVVPQTP